MTCSTDQLSVWLPMSKSEGNKKTCVTSHRDGLAISGFANTSGANSGGGMHDVEGGKLGWRQYFEGYYILYVQQLLHDHQKPTSPGLLSASSSSGSSSPGSFTASSSSGSSSASSSLDHHHQDHCHQDHISIVIFRSSSASSSALSSSDHHRHPLQHHHHNIHHQHHHHQIIIRILFSIIIIIIIRSA